MSSEVGFLSSSPRSSCGDQDPIHASWETLVEMHLPIPANNRAKVDIWVPPLYGAVVGSHSVASSLGCAPRMLMYAQK